MAASASATASAYAPASADPSAPDRWDGVDLDTHISLVEQRLIARDQRLMLHVRALRVRAAQVTEPRSLLLKVAGAAAVAVGLGWVWRQVRHRPQSRRPGRGMHIGRPPQWLLGLLPMAWPLLPARWRNRVSPGTAATVLNVAVPLVNRWFMRPPEAGHHGHGGGATPR